MAIIKKHNRSDGERRIEAEKFLSRKLNFHQCDKLLFYFIPSFLNAIKLCTQHSLEINFKKIIFTFSFKLAALSPGEFTIK